MKIIFLGTSVFSAYILEKLVESEHQIVAVISQPNRLVGRKKEIKLTSVAKYAQEKELTLFQPEKIIDIYNEIEKLEFDILITAAYGQILPEKFLNLSSLIPLNVHGSLLPKYRGPSPIQTAILNGDEKTGITIMEMIKKMDAGRIIKQEEIQIEKFENTGDIFIKLQKIGSDLLLDVLDDFSNQKFNLQDQNIEEVTYTYMLSREDEKIDLNETVEAIHNKVRAMQPYSAAYMYFNQKEMKVIKTKVLNYEIIYNIGEIISIEKDGIVVQCKDGQLLIEEIQFAGKKILPAYDYFQNFKNKKIFFEVKND